MAVITTQHHTIMQKHIVLYIFKLVKFIFLLAALMIMGWLSWKYKPDSNASSDAISIHLIVVGTLFICLNYIFVKLILETIIYFHDLVIFYKDKIVIIKNSLFYQSDLEIIDVYRIMKLNITCHGYIATIIGYGNIRIEQQNDDVKIIHFVPHPEKIVELLEVRRSTIIAERGKLEKKDKEGNYWERN